VSNFPTIPVFTVNGQDAGSVLSPPGPSVTVSVHMRVESALPLTRVRLMRNGETELYFPMTWNPNGTFWEQTVNLEIEESSWLAVRTEGTTTSPFVVSPDLFAHTGPIYVELDGEPVRRTTDAGYFCDWIDSLEVFVERRDNWPSQNERLHVLSRLNEARAIYGGLFRVPPDSFSLVTPANGDTLPNDQPITFDWTDAADAEPGDQVHYRLQLSQDSTFTFPYSWTMLTESSKTILSPPFYGRPYWWRVLALDRGNNVRMSAPARRKFYYSFEDSGIENGADGAGTGQSEPSASAGPAILARPNPSAGPVRLSCAGTGEEEGRFEIFDAAGRLLRRLRAKPGTGGAAGGARPLLEASWDALDDGGRPVPAGIYFVRYAQDQARGASAARRQDREDTLPLVLIR